MSGQDNSQSLYNEGDQTNCKTCHKSIVFLNVRHQGLAWIHEDTASSECRFLAEPEGPGMPELADNPPTSTPEKVKKK